MVPTMQFQILINIARINPYHFHHSHFFTTFLFGSVLKLLFDDFFYITFGYTISL